MPEEVRPKEEKKEFDQIMAKTCPQPFGDFRSGASWRIFRIMAEFIEGFEFLADLKKEVTVFGSARLSPSDKYYKEALKLGQLLGKAGFTVITGGGPGVMEAANRGATEVGAQSIGLNIQLPKEQRINPFVKRGKGFYYFFTRKVMLSASAQAYIFFPGGIGTSNEFFEVLELIQTRKMCPLPMICVGKQFWSGLVEWMRVEMIDRHPFIEAADLDLFKVVDTAEEAFDLIKDSAERAYF
jgi:hypothetical protein